MVHKLSLWVEPSRVLSQEQICQICQTPYTKRNSKRKFKVLLKGFSFFFYTVLHSSVLNRYTFPVIKIVSNDNFFYIEPFSIFNKCKKEHLQPGFLLKNL